jgi:ribonucleoside-diphosphate reductase alpha chain
LVNTTTNTKEVAFSQTDAVKRPKVLKGDGYIVSVKGVEYMVLVGLLEEKPYEVFASKNQWELPKHFECEIHKKAKGKYNIYIPKTDQIIEDFNHEITDEEAVITRLLSTSLRHGVSVEFLCSQLAKTTGSIVSYGKAVYRVLSKYIGKQQTGESCPECSSKLIMEEGCKKCSGCGYSKC